MANTELINGYEKQIKNMKIDEVDDIMRDDERPKSCSLKRKTSFAQGDVMKYRRSFDCYDHDKTGSIQVKYLRNVINKIGYKIPDERLDEILESVGLDDTSTINFETFLDLVPRNYSHIKEEEHKLAELRDKFQKYDLNGDGIISLNEAQWSLQSELRVTSYTALRLLNQFVKLNYEQFLDFFSQVQKTKLKIYEMFGKYDKDQDGFISKDEAYEVLHKILGYSKKRSDAMVERFDINKDGTVSYMEFAEFYIAVEEKKAKIRGAFHHFDSNCNGYVANADAEELMKNMLGFTDERCKSTIEICDKDKDGNINFEEFIDFYAILEEEREHLLLEFHNFDNDGDGLISLEEFKEMLQSQGYEEKQIDTLMTDYDKDHDGFLNYDEFKFFLNSRQ